MYKDLFGKALLDYWTTKQPFDIVTWTSISEEDVLPVSHLFRSFNEMPLLEQKALKLTQGKTLDVGCGAGSHALWLQQNGYEVKSIDISEGAIEVAKKRGIIDAELKGLLDEHDQFDTILLLMNGSGIFEDLSKIGLYLDHLKSILKPSGQVLIDSSDIIYMFDGEVEQMNQLGSPSNYYGELDYYMSYNGETEVPFKWLYIDFETLQLKAHEKGFKCQKIMDGPHYDYLAKLTVN